MSGKCMHLSELVVMPASHCLFRIAFGIDHELSIWPMGLCAQASILHLALFPSRVMSLEVRVAGVSRGRIGQMV